MPAQIAVRAGGGWLVSEPSQGRVLVIDAAGAIERTIISSTFGVVRPFGVAALPDGRIAISGRHSDLFVVIDGDDQVQARGGERGSWDGALWMPAGLEFLPDGDRPLLLRSDFEPTTEESSDAEIEVTP